MVLLRKGDSRVWKIAEKRELRADRLYRLSGFVFPYENDGIFLLKNTLTKRLYRLEKDEFDAAMSLRERSVPLSFLTEHGLELLGRARFIVEEGYDETAQYLLMLSIMRTLQDKRPGIRGYTILPTTGCNARCVYCYEEGIRSLTMTPETADRVVDFIVATKWDGAVTLHWFGGEPLAAPGIISRICRALEERGVRFTSTIITNGTLLTPEMADEARDVWKLKTAQVSLDGARVDYEARKRYVNPEKHNYDAAMEAVRLFSDRGVRVTMRCNYDAENLPRLRTFFDDIKARFGGRKNVSVYTEQIFQSASGGNGGELFAAAAEELHYLDEIGFPRVIPSDQRFKTAYCMADSGSGSALIDPEGGMHRCEHYVDDEPLGTIFDDPPPERTPILLPVQEECRGCVYLPLCTPFFKTGCPSGDRNCREYQRVKAVLSLERICADIRKKEAEA